MALFSGANLGRQALTGSNAVIYTQGANTRVDITQFAFVNRGASEAKVWVYLVDSGGAPGDGNVLYNEVPIPAKETLEINTLKVFTSDAAGGRTIQARASGSVTIHAEGAEVT